MLHPCGGHFDALPRSPYYKDLSQVLGAVGRVFGTFRIATFAESCIA